MKTEKEISEIAKNWYYCDNPTTSRYSDLKMKDVKTSVDWEDAPEATRQYFVNSVKKQLKICEKERRGEFNRGGLVDSIKREEVPVYDPGEEERQFQDDVYWNDRAGYPGDFG